MAFFKRKTGSSSKSKVAASSSSKSGYTDVPDAEVAQWKLSDFEFRETVGTGTFGRVHVSRHKKSGKYFAIKVLKKAEVVRLKQVEHLASEKNILAALRHPFIVRLYKTFQDNRNVYMVMGYVPGGELFSHLRRAGRFTVDMTRFYAAEIVLALENLHQQNFVYRDMKPENLLLDQHGHVKITDFGFAKHIPEDKTWTLCGTPEYLAPEIIQSRGHGKAVDWWALGILLYEMLAGYPPFFDDNPFGIYEKILGGRIHYPSHFDSASRDLIKRLLTADRTKRLGNLKGKAEDIKRHKFFRGVDWNLVYQRRFTPPIIPVVRSDGDTSNFDRYPEEADEGPMPDVDPFASLFKDF